MAKFFQNNYFKIKIFNFALEEHDLKMVYKIFLLSAKTRNFLKF